MIKELDQENPNSRTFNRLELKNKELLDDLKLANVELNTHLLKANPQIDNDESYKSDQKLIRDQLFLSFSVIDDYTELLNSKGIPYPPEVKPVTSLGDYLLF